MSTTDPIDWYFLYRMSVDNGYHEIFGKVSSGKVLVIEESEDEHRERTYKFYQSSDVDRIIAKIENMEVEYDPEGQDNHQIYDSGYWDEVLERAKEHWAGFK